MTIGEHIKAFREARGWSMSEMARQTPIGIASISWWERGLNLPTRETVERVAAVISIPIEQVSGTYRGKLDYAKKRTRCRHGHSRTPENTYVNSRGNKQCLTCMHARQREYYWKNREKCAALSSAYNKSEHGRKKHREYYQRNRERINDNNRRASRERMKDPVRAAKARDKSREWQRKNKAKIRAKWQERYDNDHEFRRSLYERKLAAICGNRQKYNEAERRKRANNPEKYREAGRRCYWKNPEKARALTRDYIRRNKDKILGKEQRERDELADNYIRTILRSQGYSRDAMTTEVMDAYRTILQIKRHIHPGYGKRKRPATEQRARPARAPEGNPCSYPSREDRGPSRKGDHQHIGATAEDLRG